MFDGNCGQQTLQSCNVKHFVHETIQLSDKYMTAYFSFPPRWLFSLSFVAIVLRLSSRPACYMYILAKLIFFTLQIQLYHIIPIFIT